MFFNEVLIGHWVDRTKKQLRMWLEVLVDAKQEAWNKMKAGLLWPLAVILSFPTGEGHQVGRQLCSEITASFGDLSFCW